MRVIKPISIWTVVGVIAALTLTGCWKDIMSDSKDLKFSAAVPQTKAVYGEDAGNFQQILWTGGDDIRISSNSAATYLGRHFCDYYVIPGSPDATKGTIERKDVSIGGVEDTGLRWLDGASGSADFWSVYPAAAMDENNIQYISTTIPTTTSLGVSVKTPGSNVVAILDPLDGSYPMVAHTSLSANTNLVTLTYYPAFTAFQITLINNSGGSISLSECALVSTTDNLCGSFTAPIDYLAQSDADPSFVSVSEDDAAKRVSVGMSETIANGKRITFNIFCLPTDLTNLTFECTYSALGKTETKRLALSSSDDTPIIFSAGKQHRIDLQFASGEINYEITPVIAVILSNAFPDEYKYQNGTVVDKNNQPVDIEKLQQDILNVREVVITDDHAVSTINYVSGMFAFVNLERLEIRNSHTTSSVAVEGLQNFRTLEILQASSLHDVTVSDCPMADSVVINSQSLNTVTLNNLDSLKVIRVGEGTANSNLQTFNLTNCPMLEEAYFGQVGALETLDLTGSSHLRVLEVGLAYQLKYVILTGCTSLKSIYINNAHSLPYLDISPCTSIETVTVINPQQLASFSTSSATLRELHLTGGLYQLTSMYLDTPVLNTLDLTNVQAMQDFTLKNNTVLSSLSLPMAGSIQNLTFENCSLSSFTMSGHYNNGNGITARKHNCPNLNNYTVNGQTKPFTEY